MLKWIYPQVFTYQIVMDSLNSKKAEDVEDLSRNWNLTWRNEKIILMQDRKALTCAVDSYFYTSGVSKYSYHQSCF